MFRIYKRIATCALIYGCSVASAQTTVKETRKLLEEGVEKLGDLVAKGHFGGPQESDETTENH